MAASLMCLTLLAAIIASVVSAQTTSANFASSTAGGAPAMAAAPPGITPSPLASAGSAAVPTSGGSSAARRLRELEGERLLHIRALTLGEIETLLLDSLTVRHALLRVRVLRRAVEALLGSEPPAVSPGPGWHHYDESSRQSRRPLCGACGLRVAAWFRWLGSETGHRTESLCQICALAGAAALGR